MYLYAAKWNQIGLENLILNDISKLFQHKIYIISQTIPNAGNLLEISRKIWKIPFLRNILNLPDKPHRVILRSFRDKLN